VCLTGEFGTVILLVGWRKGFTRRSPESVLDLARFMRSLATPSSISIDLKLNECKFWKAKTSSPKKLKAEASG